MIGSSIDHACTRGFPALDNLVVSVHFELVSHGVADDFTGAIDGRNFLATGNPERFHQAELLCQGPRRRWAHTTNGQTGQHLPQLLILGYVDID